MRPDREWLIVDELYVPANADSVCLPVCGWLAGISATVRTFDDWVRPRSDNPDLDGIIRVEITDCNDSALYGRFTIPVGRGYHKGGVLLPEPIPDMNSAFPYFLRFRDRPPALHVFKLGCCINSEDSMSYREENVWRAA